MLPKNSRANNCLFSREKVTWLITLFFLTYFDVLGIPSEKYTNNCFPYTYLKVVDPRIGPAVQRLVSQSMYLHLERVTISVILVLSDDLHSLPLGWVAHPYFRKQARHSRISSGRMNSGGNGIIVMCYLCQSFTDLQWSRT